MSLHMAFARASARRGYAGDPGIGSLFKKGLGLLGKAGIPGLSQAAGLASTLLTSSKPIGVLPSKMPAGFGGKAHFFPGGPGLPATPGFASGIAPGYVMPPLPSGPLPFAPPELGPAPAGSAQANGRPAGHKLNKTGYWLKSGEYVAPGSRWVRIRRRNPLNPRALDRAMGRLVSAQRAAKKMQKIHIGPPHRRAAAKPAKRKR